MPADEAMLDEALAVAQLPALLAASGACDRRHVLAEARVAPGLPAAVAGRDRPGTGDRRRDPRRGGAPALVEFLAGERKLPPAPDAATVRQMMDFVAGTDIAEGYADFAMGRAGPSSAAAPRTRSFDQPQLKAARPQAEGAGDRGRPCPASLPASGSARPGSTSRSSTRTQRWAAPGSRTPIRAAGWTTSNHMYSYSFEPNHAWPQFFSPQPELLKYFKGIADKYGLRKHIRFETLVETCVWDEAKAIWRVTLKGRGRGPRRGGGGQCGGLGGRPAETGPRYPDNRGP